MRDKLGEGQRIDFAELVTLGAEVKARRMTTEDAAAATSWLSAATIASRRSMS